MKLSDYPPGFAAHRYRPTPEEIEELRQWNRIRWERDKRDREKLIEEGKLPPDTKSEKKTA